MVQRDAPDSDSIALRLLCEKAEERLEQAAAAAELARYVVQLPDGSYHRSKDEESDQPR
jgi:hypothetical protein